MRPMPELTIEEVPTEELVPYARNAKIHTEEQVEQIASSISEFGFNDPVGVWDSPEGLEIVEGHGRIMAAKKLGLVTVPVVRLNHLDEEQRRAYMLVHNQLTMNTGWNIEMLEAELAKLDGMDMFGFDDEAETDGDEQEEVPARIPFAKAVDLKRDYIVLMFDNEIDSMYAAQLLGVEPANLLATGRAVRYGTGRVIDGIKAIERLRGNDD